MPRSNYIKSVALLCLLALPTACSSRTDAKRLDRILSIPGAVDSLQFRSPSTTNDVYFRGVRVAEFLAALAATNRIKAHSWGKGQVVAQVAGSRDGRWVFSISVFEDGVFRVEDY